YLNPTPFLVHHHHAPNSPSATITSSRITSPQHSRLPSATAPTPASSLTPQAGPTPWSNRQKTSPPVPSLVSSLLLLETRLFVIAQGDDNLKCETVGCAAGTACTYHANTAAVAAAAESVNDASFCPVICTLQTLPRTAKQLSVTTGLTRSDVSFPASAFLIPVAQTSRPQPHVESPPAPNILAKTEK
ncbi:hypothetical protein IAQ61_011492, partial [Plenodomus lingam]|uniref:uncharacterized protein n=1 Tax=Leptosphaeria maculans TaxID=5022 RepID=UPI0033265D60